ncbi:Protein REGULATOR OF FATTY ACID COMPOSITION 3, chloroplastic [Linum perenne]
MARKGSQQKNGIPNHKKKIPDSEVKGQGKGNQAKVFPGEGLQNGDQPAIPSTDAVKKTHVGDENRLKQQKSGKPQKKEKQGAGGGHEVEEPAISGFSLSDPSNTSSESTRWKEEYEAGSANGQTNWKNMPGYLMNRFQARNLVDTVDFSGNMAARNLRASSLSLLKAAGEWIEKQRPLFIALTTNLSHVRDYARQKFEVAYPIAMKWLAHLGNIVILLSVVWLDCTLRGIDSFLRMGTTSFFSVIWCSILSIIAMAGISKFLIVLGIAAAVGVFIGFTLGLLVVAISATIFLWCYGSFWTTACITVISGLTFLSSHESLALLITTAYSVYCAWGYVGWLGLLLALNLAFISSDILVYFLKNNIHRHRRSDGSYENSAGPQDIPNFSTGESFPPGFPESVPGASADRSPGVASTSGTDSELSSEDEVIRLLNCTDHYSALGLSRYGNVDVTLLKKEYRKKAMLVHPDKNMGNDKAAEAFKKLQNAYEILLDSSKQKAYDDELRREELLNYFRRFHSNSQKNGEHGPFPPGFSFSEADGDDPFGDSRRIACKRCGSFHIWVYTAKQKSRARWCQECKDFHPAKDGDGWVEQPTQPLLFGLLQKVEAPFAYVCADSKIYNATEWYNCQGMRCPANTHKPSFHVNTSLTTRHTSTNKGSSSSGQKNSRMPPPEETMTEEEFYEWFQNAMQSGAFDNNGGRGASAAETASSSKAGGKSGGSSNSKKKKKGKKQWSAQIGCAKKKKDKKDDDHYFVPKPDEATGPFPEAVLLRKKKVQEDGSVLPEFADAEEKELYDFLNLELQSGLNVDRMRHYEVVYLIHEKYAEEVGSVNEKVQAVMLPDFLREKKGKVWRMNDWGMRRLAYRIQKAWSAHYILMNFEMEAKWINEFKTLLDKDERVIRHLVITRDKAITEDCPPPLEFHEARANLDGSDEDGDEDDEYDDDEDDDDDDDDDDEDSDDDDVDWDEEEEEEEEDNDEDEEAEDGVVIVNINDDDEGSNGKKSKSENSTKVADKVRR